MPPRPLSLFARPLLALLILTRVIAASPPATGDSAPNAEALFTRARGIQLQFGGADSDKIAADLLRQAADLGHAAAQYWLGRSHAWGDGVPQDRTLALKWIQTSARQGYWNACAELAEQYLGHAQTPQLVTVDHAEGLKWLEQAGTAGYLLAYLELFNAHQEGNLGLPKDPARAVGYLRKAIAFDPNRIPADLEGPDRFMPGYFKELLGIAYLRGEGVPFDPTQAARLLTEGDTGERGGAGDFYRSLLHANGAGGFPQDPAKAMQLLAGIDEHRLDPPTLAEFKRVKQALAQPAAASAKSVTGPRLTVPEAWQRRSLRAPAGYEMLQPSDIFVGFSWRRVLDGSGNYVDNEVGVISLSSMRMSPGNTHDEADLNRRRFYGGSAMVPREHVIRGSDLLGRISLGWVAYAKVSEWWPENGFSYPHEAAGLAYGAASLEEAMEQAFSDAIAGYRMLTSAAIRVVYVEAGVSAKPDWDAYARAETITNISAMPFFVYGHFPPKQSDADNYSAHFNFPDDPAALVKYLTAGAGRARTYHTTKSSLTEQSFGFPAWTANMPAKGMARPRFDILPPFWTGK